MQEIIVDEEEEEFEMKRKPVDELVAFLDLDKCSIYGESGLHDRGEFHGK